MRYFLHEKQPNGCDYTIGCGVRLSEIEGAQSMNEAVQMATALNPSPGEDLEWNARIITKGEMALSHAEVLAVSEVVVIDLEFFRTVRQALRDKASVLSREASDRTEYERLHKKFG